MEQPKSKYDVPTLQAEVDRLKDRIIELGFEFFDEFEKEKALPPFLGDGDGQDPPVLKTEAILIEQKMLEKQHSTFTRMLKSMKTDLPPSEPGGVSMEELSARLEKIDVGVGRIQQNINTIPTP